MQGSALSPCSTIYHHTKCHQLALKLEPDCQWRFCMQMVCSSMCSPGRTWNRTDVRMIRWAMDISPRVQEKREEVRHLAGVEEVEEK